MTLKYKTRDVAKALYVNYLKKAEECLHAAKNSFASQEWNAAAINAIHSCISACDAFCVYFLGKRFAGESHDDAVKLFRTIRHDDDKINENANRFLRIIRIKNMAEYEERLVYRTEAEKILKDCDRFFEYIKKRLPYHG
jgi:uncharacterized protein (UPF0332 family)